MNMKWEKTLRNESLKINLRFQTWEYDTPRCWHRSVQQCRSQKNAGRKLIERSDLLDLLSKWMSVVSLSHKDVIYLSTDGPQKYLDSRQSTHRDRYPKWKDRHPHTGSIPKCQELLDTCVSTPMFSPWRVKQMPVSSSSKCHEWVGRNFPEKLGRRFDSSKGCSLWKKLTTCCFEATYNYVRLVVARRY